MKGMTDPEYEKRRDQMVSLVMESGSLTDEIQLKALCNYAYAIGYSAGYAEGHSDASNGLYKRQVAHVNATYGDDQ